MFADGFRDYSPTVKTCVLQWKPVSNNFSEYFCSFALCDFTSLNYFWQYFKLCGFLSRNIFLFHVSCILLQMFFWSKFTIIGGKSMDWSSDLDPIETLNRCCFHPKFSPKSSSSSPFLLSVLHRILLVLLCKLYLFPYYKPSIQLSLELSYYPTISPISCFLKLPLITHNGQFKHYILIF